jgi:hypothetical protein
VNLDPTLRQDAAQRAQDALDRAADLRAQAAAQEAKALLLGRTWRLAVDANVGLVIMPHEERQIVAAIMEPELWCTCGAKTPQPEYHAGGCPAYQQR